MNLQHTAFLIERQSLIILFSLYLLMNPDPGPHVLWYLILNGPLWCHVYASLLVSTL